MANTTFANLKIGALRRAGNHFNANDSTLLELAGGLINDVMGMLQTWLEGTPYTIDEANTVNTTASQAYVDLSDTDIIEITQVYQKVSDTKLKQIDRLSYVGAVPDSAVITGVPELAWYPKQTVNASGVNIWSIVLIPTPSAVQAIFYDYIKNLRFSVDGTGANAEFCKLPSTYNPWIFAEFKPLFYGIVDKSNRTLIKSAEEEAMKMRSIFLNSIRLPKDKIMQCGSSRDILPISNSRVETTEAP